MAPITRKNMQSFCRTCLSQLRKQSASLGEKYNIHEVDKLSSWMLACTTIAATPTDHFPKFVCQQCYEKLRCFNEFRCMSLRSMRILSSVLTGSKQDGNVNASCDDMSAVPQHAGELQPNEPFDNGDSLHFDLSRKTRQQRPAGKALLLGKIEHVDDKNMVMTSLLEPDEMLRDPVELPIFKTEIEPDLEAENEMNIGFQLPVDQIKIDEVNINENFELSLTEQPLEQDALEVSPVYAAPSRSQSSDNDDSDAEDYAEDKGSSETDSSGDAHIPLAKRIRESSSKTRHWPRRTRSTTAGKSMSVSKSARRPTTSAISPKKPNNALFQCERCPRRCVSQENLQAHMRTHDGLKPFECAECKHAFNKAYHYRVHMREVHAPVKQEIVCSFPGCGKIFTRESSYKLHFRCKHSEEHRDREPKTYICEQCGCVFRNVTKLKEHGYKHAGIESYPHKCEQCGKRFNKQRTYKEHLLRHAGIKNFVCPYCGMKKTTRSELRTHINYHTKEKQWPCKQCPMIFNSSANLGIHDRVVHKGIKRYACRYCDQSFGKSDTWKHHEMRHTGEKPHGCEICGKRFIQSVALRAHLKTHNKLGHKQAPAPVPTPLAGNVAGAGRDEVATTCMQIVRTLNATQQSPH